jgi:hypothetical protein
VGQHLLGGGQLVPFARAGHLCHNLLRLVRVDRDQMGTWYPRPASSGSATQRLAIHRQRLTGLDARLPQPMPQGSLEGNDIQGLEEPMQRGHTRRPPRGQAQRHEQLGRILQPLAAPLGNRR